MFPAVVMFCPSGIFIDPTGARIAAAKLVSSTYVTPSLLL
jgi:hypothetical protein